jgi:hypothetical protein
MAALFLRLHAAAACEQGPLAGVPSRARQPACGCRPWWGWLLRSRLLRWGPPPQTRAHWRRRATFASALRRSPARHFQFCQKTWQNKNPSLRSRSCLRSHSLAPAPGSICRRERAARREGAAIVMARACRGPTGQNARIGRNLRLRLASKARSVDPAPKARLIDPSRLEHHVARGPLTVDE